MKRNMFGFVDLEVCEFRDFTGAVFNDIVIKVVR